MEKKLNDLPDFKQAAWEQPTVAVLNIIHTNFGVGTHNDGAIVAPDQS